MKSRDREEIYHLYWMFDLYEKGKVSFDKMKMCILHETNPIPKWKRLGIEIEKHYCVLKENKKSRERDAQDLRDLRKGEVKSYIFLIGRKNLDRWTKYGLINGYKILEDKSIQVS